MATIIEHIRELRKQLLERDATIRDLLLDAEANNAERQALRAWKNAVPWTALRNYVSCIDDDHSDRYQAENDREIIEAWINKAGSA